MSSFTKFLLPIGLVTLLVTLVLTCSDSETKKTVNENNPGTRWGHTFIYHPAQQHLLLFGGTNKRGGGYLNDTWIWKDEKWKRLDIPGPPARGFCAAAYHAERKTIVLHGGRGNDRRTYSDLWEWDGLAWKQLEDSSAYKADHHQIVYLKDKKTLLAFGGWNGKVVLGDTWQWSDEWEQLEISSPPKRSAFGMVYNNKTSKVNLYGGLWINGQYADLWEWYDGQWLSLGGPYDNSSLDHHAMVYDDKLEKVIGFGGKNYRYKAQQTTFEIDSNEVVSVSKEGPAARHSFGFAYDTNSKAVYLYGGKEYKNEEQIALGDFWKWDGEQWNEITHGSAKD